MRILRIESLPPMNVRWIDRDMIMLHSCFQILKDFIEKEKGLEHSNYETHKHFIEEAKFLYNWWNERVNVSNNLFQNEEDNEMLIRLIKIRLFLWT